MADDTSDHHLRGNFDPHLKTNQITVKFIAIKYSLNEESINGRSLKRSSNSMCSTDLWKSSDLMISQALN